MQYSHNIIMHEILSLSNITFQLKSQFPTRPIVLIGFSLAGRIAAKVSVLYTCRGNLIQKAECTIYYNYRAFTLYLLQPSCSYVITS